MGFIGDMSRLMKQAKEIDKTFDPGQQMKDGMAKMKDANAMMAAQTLASAGRNQEAIARLKAGVASAERSGNSHALSEMQAMLEDLER